MWMLTLKHQLRLTGDMQGIYVTNEYSFIVFDYSNVTWNHIT